MLFTKSVWQSRRWRSERELIVWKQSEGSTLGLGFGLNGMIPYLETQDNGSDAEPTHRSSGFMLRKLIVFTRVTGINLSNTYLDYYLPARAIHRNLLDWPSNT